MKVKKENYYGQIKERRFALSLLAIYWGTLLLMSGIHSGLIVMMEKLQWNAFIKSTVPILYWGMVAVGLTLFARQRIKSSYAEPLHKMADATRKVSEGDFSVYIPTVHTADRLDYLDVMILDFNKMVEELGSIETLKTDFISNVSHEMKTPISIIKNYAQLLQTGKASEKQEKEYAKEIENAASRLSSLISNILKLNKLEHQRITPEAAVYDVCRQLCESVFLFEDAMEEKGLGMEADIEDVAMVRADASLMELVWNNLLSNAVKFTERGGCITIRQTSDESYVRVSVTDTGCGIAREHINHIFDKFYQGDTSHSTEGNGLGLALVKRVLELMDGEIQITSEEGKGSTFLVVLPVAGTESQARREGKNG
ncbi:MAG: HAMP domain-containing histidine kinase [Lachnospiraceae bacterium]|nr:HAMP domain-containing histidine kinase [Lachnospiraceae bacterium]